MSPSTAEYPWAAFTVGQVRDLLRDAPGRWWLSGGEALDLFLGFRSREHGDIDVTVQRSDWPTMLDHLTPRLEVFVAWSGRTIPVDAWRSGGDRDRRVNNLWARCHGGGPWRVQFNLEDVVDGVWLYRPHPAVRRPVDEVVQHRDGTPTANPAVQLLWKAKAPRPQDEHDLALVLPRLTAGERDWLRCSIRTAHPQSPWSSGM